MERIWLISGIYVGIMLILASAVILILSLATKVFYTGTTNKAAGDAIYGKSLIDQAAVTWDGTGIVLDSTGNLVKWSSTSSYSDVTNGPLYKYDLVKNPPAKVVNISTSNTGMTGVNFDGSFVLQNTLSSTRGFK